MLEETLAKKLIERVSEYTSYNVNIMNEDGIIIASVDPKRVGTFHEAAYVITHNDRDVIMVEDSEEYEGTAPGINMVIQIDGKRIGVVGVSGKPEEIRPVANITKMAIEVLIKYERQKLQSIRRQTKKERFIEMICSIAKTLSVSQFSAVWSSHSIRRIFWNLSKKACSTKARISVLHSMKNIY